MQIHAIRNQDYRNTFTSKVIVSPNTMTKLAYFMQDNPPGAKSILNGLKALEKNGNNDVVMVENSHSNDNMFVIWVFEKLKNKIVRNEYSHPIDVSLYTFKANVQQCYEKAKSNMVDIKSLNLSGFEAFNPFK